MDLSIWMFYDALNEYKPQIVINEPEKINIQNIRLYSPEMEIIPNNLYVEKSDIFFHDGSEKIVCVHGSNLITLESTNLNKVFNSIFIFWEDIQSWLNHINGMLSSNCLLKDILDEFSDRLPFPLMVLDSSQVAIALSTLYGLGTIDDKWDHMLLTGSFGADTLSDYNAKHNEMIHTQNFYYIPADPFTYPSYNHNIYINNEFMGFFSVILKTTGFSNVHKAWAEILYSFVASWMTVYADKNDLLVKNAFFLEMLNGNKKNIERFNAALITQGWKDRAEKKDSGTELCFKYT